MAACGHDLTRSARRGDIRRSCLGPARFTGQRSLVGGGHPEVATPSRRQEEFQHVVDCDYADHPMLIVDDGEPRRG